MNTNGEWVNNRQIAWLTCTLLSSGGLITFPRELIRVSGKEAWTCFLLPVAFAFLIIYLYTTLMRRYPGQHIFAIMVDSFGSIAGNVFNAIFIGYIWIMVSRDISALSFFLNSTILVNTPREMIILLLGPALMYYGKLGLEPVARVNDFSLPLLVVLLLLMPLLVSSELRPELMLPAFGGSVISLLYGNVANMGWIGDLLVIGAFLHVMHDGGRTRAYLRLGAIFAIVILVMNVWLNVTVMGSNIAGRVLFPNHALVEQIQITDFMDRLEVFVYVIWFPVYFVKTAITSLALFIGFAHFAGNDNYRRISGTASWLIVITSVFAYNSIIELINFINYSLTFIVIAIITPIMLLVTLRAVTTRQTKNKMPENKQTKSKQPEIKQAENTGRFSWTYISNGLLAVFAILIAIGQWYGKDWPAVGTAASVGIGVVLLGMVASTFMEVRNSTS